jgi:hypothetical protein
MPYIQVMRHRRATVALLIVLSGCFTGPRPSYTTDPFPAGTPTGDAAIDKVLAQLDAVNDGPYTVDYTVLTKFGNTSRTASVSVEAGRRSVTVGNVRFITANGAFQTCVLDKTDPCSSSIEPARISDTQITPDFYAADSAKRLRRTAVARIGSTIPHTEQIAGQSATCVDVPVTGGVSTFCALTNGPLARLDDGAVTIELTQYTPALDESLFATTGS